MEAKRAGACAKLKLGDSVEGDGGLVRGHSTQRSAKIRTQKWKSETRKSLWPEIKTPGEMGNWQENQLIVLRFGLIWGVAGTQPQCLSREMDL